ncbi:MFS general substrate transporter [Westerdykella ornata]|uniref:MFS general substrate transporter n=1 Tax=Westerdykella ornata TaxID=318751 RepID=A0A6A6JBR5_WESOR|nr:MFS general substrate transporter [Westerdykella ornata]KAF2273654.1 MFS general substrate transporter [Westerdykella ornata]
MRMPWRATAAQAEVPVVDQEQRDEKADASFDKEANASQPRALDNDSEEFTPNAQDGVKKIEATTTVWSKRDLIIAYILIWLIMFVDSMQQGATGSLTAYVTSDFYQHSLTGYTSTMSSIIGGVLKLPLAKVLDIFGRPQGFMLMVAFMVLGLIMMAACNDVQVYAAAQIFYWVGYNGLSYTLGIFVADTSSLKNRGFMYAYISSPYIATVWIAGPLATAFLNGPGWRWCFGAFAIITVAITLPLYFLFQLNYKKAVKRGIIVPTKSNRTFMESVKYYAIEFDVGGLFLVMGGLVFFLLPFNLYSYQEGQWKSPLVISFFIIGGLMLIAFALFEKYYAAKTFIPYSLLLDRTVIGACILSAVLFVSWYIWHSYFFSFLQVVNGVSVTEATYILNIYSIGSCFFSFIVGIAIRWTGRFKWIALYFGVPVTILGVGLLIHFRQPDVNIGYIVMTQIFIAFAGGACVITEQIAVMAATDHQYVAVVLALEGMFSSIGGGIGSSIATAVWTGVFPKRLAEYLPPESQGALQDIYAQLTVQMSYAKGTPTRIAIERAYSDAQKYMNIGGTAILILAIPAVMMWRDIKVKDFKQVKGRVI